MTRPEQKPAGFLRPIGVPDPDFGARWGIPVLRLDNAARRAVAATLGPKRTAPTDGERKVAPAFRAFVEREPQHASRSGLSSRPVTVSRVTRA